MDQVYAYAEAQFLGTKFDPFTFATPAQRYRWDSPVGPALALLVRIGLRPVARVVFMRLVRVEER